MKDEKLFEYVNVLKDELNEAYDMLAEYEAMLCVRFCGWLKKVMATLAFWRKS